MNTRRAKDGQFNQESYASAAEYEQGLLANLCAKRCALLQNPAHAESVFFLQYHSWQPGGLKKFAADLTGAFPDLVATRTMQKFGTRPGQRYTASQADAVRDEMITEETIAEAMHASYQRQSRPMEAAECLKICRDEAAANLKNELTRFSLDPNCDTLAPWYFPTLLETIAEYQTLLATRAASRIAETEISRHVFETLDYGSAGGCLVMASGQARTGKTIAAKSWCAARPGVARYVQCPASNDDISFFRVIAQALGISSALSLKGVQMRERIEQVLQSTRIMLVIDEAHYLWPQNNRREALPNRINWILTALVNYGVPVALVTTPQFTRDQHLVERKSGWNSAQFMGRIAFYKPLPNRLNPDELPGIVRFHLPDADENSVSYIANAATLSSAYVATIENAVNRARHEARKAGRAKVTFADVKNAVKNYIVPTETALAQTISAGAPRSGRPPRAAAVAPAAAIAPQAAPASASRSIAPVAQAAPVNRIPAAAEATHFEP